MIRLTPWLDQQESNGIELTCEQGRLPWRLWWEYCFNLLRHLFHSLFAVVLAGGGQMVMGQHLQVCILLPLKIWTKYQI